MKMLKSLGEIMTLSCLIELFPRKEIIVHHRPNWLINSKTMNKMELDFFIPDKNIAVEYNGNQHYAYNKYFHTSREEFEKQIHRDTQKIVICASKNIKLVTIPHQIDVKHRCNHKKREAIYKYLSLYV